MKLLNITLISVFALVLSGCGGGEDTTDVNANTAIPSQALAITSANAQEVARTALNIAIEPIESSETAINLISVAKNETQANQVNLISFARDQLKWMDSSFITNNDLNYGIASIIPADSVDNCDNTGDGTSAISFNDNDGDSNLSNGDSFSIALSNCLVNEDQATYSGNMLMTFDAITGDPVAGLSWDIAISFVFDNFSITSVDGTTGELSGDMNFTIGTTDTIDFIGTLSGNKLNYVSANAPAELSDYLLTFDSDENDEQYQHTIRGTLASSALNGTFDITPISFFEAHQSFNPHSGTIRATGANNSSVTIEAMSDASAVQLRIDSDGDGIIDNVIDTTWSTLGR